MFSEKIHIYSNTIGIELLKSYFKKFHKNYPSYFKNFKKSNDNLKSDVDVMNFFRRTFLFECPFDIEFKKDFNFDLEKNEWTKLSDNIKYKIGRNNKLRSKHFFNVLGDNYFVDHFKSSDNIDKLIKMSFDIYIKSDIDLTILNAWYNQSDNLDIMPTILNCKTVNELTILKPLRGYNYDFFIKEKTPLIYILPNTSKNVDLVFHKDKQSFDNFKGYHYKFNLIKEKLLNKL